MRRGFTLVELAITMIIATIAVYSLLTIFITAATENVDIEALTMGLYLASGRLEEISSQSYDSIASQASAPFSSGFGDFNNEVVVDYVSSEALDTLVETDFGYKKITVRVTSDNLPSSIEVSTLATDISNE